jgi:hypothetical protein
MVAASKPTFSFKAEDVRFERTCPLTDTSFSKRVRLAAPSIFQNDSVSFSRRTRWLLGSLSDHFITLADRIRTCLLDTHADFVLPTELLPELLKVSIVLAE